MHAHENESFPVQNKTSGDVHKCTPSAFMEVRPELEVSFDLFISINYWEIKNRCYPRTRRDVTSPRLMCLVGVKCSIFPLNHVQFKWL